jgi:hypothetical protein
MTPNNGLMSAANKSKVATPILDKLRAELRIIIKGFQGKADPT